MATAPATLTGLTDRGSIAPGQQANLCVFAPDETFVVDPVRLLHRNPITPYAGRGNFAASSSRRGCMVSRLGTASGAGDPSAHSSDED